MTTTSDWCERLDDAISEGRFLEDPAQWRAHVLSCPPCRKKAESVFDLQEHYERLATNAPVVQPQPEESLRVINAVFARYARRQALIRRGTLGGLAVLLLAVGVALWARPSPEAPPADPLARARALRAKVFTRGEPSRYHLLRSDPALRQEFLDALEDENSEVRRTALHALMYGNVPLPEGKLEEILKGWKEDLGAPIEVAGVDGDERRQEILDRAADTTAFVVLRGAHAMALQNGTPPLRKEVVIPFLSYADSNIRGIALRLLALDPSYVPDETVERLLRTDSLFDIRVAAAESLLKRGGDAGIDTVLATLREKPDPEVEPRIVNALARSEKGRMFLRERMEDPTTADVTWASAAVALRSSGAEFPLGRLQEIVARPDADALGHLVRLAEMSGWRHLRGPLAERWRVLEPGWPRTRAGTLLVQWDMAVGTPEAMRQALEISRIERNAAITAALKRMAASEVSDVRAEAERLLRERGE
jgi:hypothetical protein